MRHVDEEDLRLLASGSHRHLWELLGAHLRPGGADFAVWAPNARRVAVTGDFDDWQAEAHTLAPVGQSGVFAGSAPAKEGQLYKFAVTPANGGAPVFKADPIAFGAELPPGTASRLCSLAYDWQDDAWMRRRQTAQRPEDPISIYELHLGSFAPRQAGRFLHYDELAPLLIEHVQHLGFTHVEFLPVMEHPFYGSWGYQTTGYFAPSARYGTPQQLMALIDALHGAGIGVILDWVPSHFPADAHSLGRFDGTCLYEHEDPRLGFHPDWKSLIFNYGRYEVQAFLISSALFWLQMYHADGLRVDAVASMLYRDYSRRDGEWLPNAYGGRENLDAIAFLRALNTAVRETCPGAVTIAEESTAFAGVSRPVSIGGLGFGYKWDMGFMHDTLSYFARDPVHRSYHQQDLTFRSVYAFSENFVLPLSHDEVVYGKGALLAKMPGDRWQKFANLRLLYSYLYAQPGKKLLFMGSEFGQAHEWNHDGALDWQAAHGEQESGLRRLVSDLNRLYRERSALHVGDCQSSGFAFADAADRQQSVISFMRLAGAAPPLLCIFNFTPVVRHGYRLGVPNEGAWRELFNSDSAAYTGSNVGNLGRLVTIPEPCHGHAQALNLTLPPLAALILEPEG